MTCRGSETSTTFGARRPTGLVAAQCARVWWYLTLLASLRSLRVPTWQYQTTRQPDKSSQVTALHARLQKCPLVWPLPPASLSPLKRSSPSSSLAVSYVPGSSLRSPGSIYPINLCCWVTNTCDNRIARRSNPVPPSVSFAVSSSCSLALASLFIFDRVSTTRLAPLLYPRSRHLRPVVYILRRLPSYLG